MPFRSAKSRIVLSTALPRSFLCREVDSSFRWSTHFAAANIRKALRSMNLTKNSSIG